MLLAALRTTDCPSGSCQLSQAGTGWRGGRDEGGGTSIKMILSKKWNKVKVACDVLSRLGANPHALASNWVWVEWQPLWTLMLMGRGL